MISILGHDKHLRVRILVPLVVCDNLSLSLLLVVVLVLLIIVSIIVIVNSMTVSMTIITFAV